MPIISSWSLSGVIATQSAATDDGHGISRKMFSRLWRDIKHYTKWHLLGFVIFTELRCMVNHTSNSQLMTWSRVLGMLTVVQLVKFLTFNTTQMLSIWILILSFVGMVKGTDCILCWNCQICQRNLMLFLKVFRLSNTPLQVPSEFCTQIKQSAPFLHINI